MSPARCETSTVNGITGRLEKTIHRIGPGKHEVFGTYLVLGTKSGFILEKNCDEPGEEVPFVEPDHYPGPDSEEPFCSLGGTIFVTPEREKPLISRILDIIRHT